MKIEYRHSASKTNTFLDSPAFWIINELFDFESEPNARMVMGLAAEDAAHQALSKQITDEDTIRNFAKKKYIEESKDDYESSDNESEESEEDDESQQESETEDNENFTQRLNGRGRRVRRRLM